VRVIEAFRVSQSEKQFLHQIFRHVFAQSQPYEQHMEAPPIGSKQLQDFINLFAHQCAFLETWMSRRPKAQLQSFRFRERVSQSSYAFRFRSCFHRTRFWRFHPHSIRMAICSYRYEFALMMTRVKSGDTI